MSEFLVTRGTIEEFLNQINLRGKEAHTAQMAYDIVNSYGESHRHYHTLEHIADCFKEYEEVKKNFTKPTMAKFALLYHDIIYIPGYNCNEDVSANRAEMDLLRLGFKRWECLYVTHCITSTEGLICVESKDQEVLHDIDYAILGQDREKFDAYEKAIRKEFCTCDDDRYQQGRVRFLTETLKQKHIYLTDHFRKKYEKKARESIKYLIGILSKVK